MGISFSQAGRPDRGKDQAEREYQAAMAEMMGLLRAGRPLEELWRVSRGELRYADYMVQHGAAGTRSTRPAESNGGGSRAASPAPPPVMVVELPSAPPSPPPVELGSSLSRQARDPLALIKQVAPVPTLTAAKEAQHDSPLAPLVQSLAVDPAIVWRRIYPLGSKAELLVAVLQPEGPDGASRVELYTDSAASLVLHWGVCPPASREWTRPPASIHPKGTMNEEGISVETPVDTAVPDLSVPVNSMVINLPKGKVFADFYVRFVTLFSLTDVTW